MTDHRGDIYNHKFKITVKSRYITFFFKLTAESGNFEVSAIIVQCFTILVHF